MEETKLEKQNKNLKIILAVLLVLLVVPAISIGSIMAYSFLNKKPDPNAAGSQGVSPAANIAANSSSPTPAPAAKVPSQAPTAQNPAGPSFPNPVGGSLPFEGRWRTIGGDGTTYSFSAPKKVGNSEVGVMKVTTAQGKSYDSNYTIFDRKGDKFEANGREYTFEIEDNGKTLTLEFDGNIMRFDRLP